MGKIKFILMLFFLCNSAFASDLFFIGSGITDENFYEENPLRVESILKRLGFINFSLSDKKEKQICQVTNKEEKVENSEIKSFDSREKVEEASEKDQLQKYNTFLLQRIEELLFNWENFSVIESQKNRKVEDVVSYLKFQNIFLERKEVDYLAIIAKKAEIIENLEKEIELQKEQNCLLKQSIEDHKQVNFVKILLFSSAIIATALYFKHRS